MTTENKPNHPCVLSATFDGLELAAERLNVDPNKLANELESVRIGREVLAAFMQAADDNDIQCPGSSVNSNGTLTCPFADEVSSAAKALQSKAQKPIAADSPTTTDTPTSYLAQLGINGR